MKVQLDLVGSTARRDPDGTHYERLALVTGVTAREKLRAVLDAPGIPKRGDPHPQDPSTTVRTVSVVPAEEDARSFLVTISYSSSSAADTGENLSLSDPIEVRYEARSTTESTIFDRHGNKMTTFYTESAAQTAILNRTAVTAAHRVELERPGVVINITRTTRETPDTLNKRYGARVNSGKWGGYDRYQVLCEGFEGQGARGSSLWRVTGRFYPSPLLDGTWRVQLLARNGENIFPTDARAGRGIHQYEPYKLAALRNSGFVP